MAEKQYGKIVALTRLGEKRKAEIRKLEAECKAHDGTEAVAELENELNYSKRLRCFFLCYGRGGVLAGFLNIFCPDGEYAEVTAFVAPGFRKKGIFTAMAGAAAAELKKNGIRKRLYVTEPASADAAAAAGKMNLNLQFSELLMTLEGPGGKCENVSKAGLNPNRENEYLLRARPGADNERTYHFMSDEGRTEIGGAQVYFYGTGAFIHHVEIYEDYRGNGYGKRFVSDLIGSLLKEHPGCAIKLQVTSTNLPALHIYRGLGFVVESQRDYYE